MSVTVPPKAQTPFFPRADTIDLWVGCLIMDADSGTATDTVRSHCYLICIYRDLCTCRGEFCMTKLFQPNLCYKSVSKHSQLFVLTTF